MLGQRGHQAQWRGRVKEKGVEEVEEMPHRALYENRPEANFKSCGCTGTRVRRARAETQEGNDKRERERERETVGCGGGVRESKEPDGGEHFLNGNNNKKSSVGFSIV